MFLLHYIVTQIGGKVQTVEDKDYFLLILLLQI